MLRAAVLLASVALVVAVPSAVSDTRAARSVTIRVFETPVTQTLVMDVPPRTVRLLGKLTKGDTILVTAILRNVVPQFGEPKGVNVGTFSSAVVALSPQTVSQDSVSSFPRGTVHVHGERKITTLHWKLPIVGGTGIYTGASGVVDQRILVTSGAAGDRLNIYRLQVP